MRTLLVASALATILLGLAAPPASAADVSGLSGIALSQSDPAAGGIAIRLVDIPASAQDDPRAHSYIVDNLPPGTTIERRIEVSNSTSAEQTVAVYAGSARINDGSFVGDDGTSANELTGWTSFDRPDLILAAGESTEVLVTIAVPADAAEGEQYAAIWSEMRSKPDAKSNIVSASRVGIRMYVSVGAGNGPPADFSLTKLVASRDASGTPQVTATVTNTGGRALDLSGTLTLTDGPSGLAAGPFSTSNAITLALDDTDEVVVTLGPDLPSGPWQATLTLSSGLLSHDTSASITFPDTGQSVEATVGDNTARNLAIVAGAPIVLAAAAAWAWRVVRRKRSPEPASHRHRAEGRRTPDEE